MKIPMFYNQYFDEYLMFFFLFISLNIFIKIPISIISSIYSKSLLNNLACPPPTQDIEMNSFANEGETEQFTNKSD